MYIGIMQVSQTYRSLISESLTGNLRLMWSGMDWLWSGGRPIRGRPRQFLSTTGLPLCAGGFGEIGEDFDKVITRLAREAAAGDHGLRISPLVNTDRKGGAFPIMLQQFRRAIGVAIVRGNARHKSSVDFTIIWVSTT